MKRMTSDRRIVIYREPHPKERPRVSMIAGHPKIYTPRDTREFEKAVSDAWKKEHGDSPFTGPVTVMIILGMKIPKGSSKAKIQKMLDRQIRPTVKPDVDNCAKSILDALNGLAYMDDNQIVGLTVRKYYMEIPQIQIAVAEWHPKEE